MKKIIPLLIASFLLAVLSIGKIQAQALTIKITSSTNPTCPYDSNGSAFVLATGGYAPYTYLWEPGGQTTDSATNLGIGTYTVLVTDSAFDSATSQVTLT